MRKLLLVITLLYCLFITQISFGATYYVRTDGSNSNAGTSDTAGGAFLTVQYAANTATAGDTVQIRAGTYLENVSLPNTGATNSPLIIKGEPGVTLGGIGLSKSFQQIRDVSLNMTNVPSNEGVIQLTTNSRWCVASNITVVGYADITYRAAVVWTEGTPESGYFDDIKVTNPNGHVFSIGAGTGFVITNCWITGSTGWDVFRILSSNTKVVNNTVTNLTNPGDANPNHCDVFQTFGDDPATISTNILIEGNLILGATNYQLGNMTDDQENGNISYWMFRNNVFSDISSTLNLFVPNVSFLNNTFYRVGDLSAWAIIIGKSTAGWSDNLTIKNNLFVECGTADSATRGWYSGDVVTNMVANYNLVVGTGAGTTKTGFTSGGFESNGINGTAPTFANISEGNFRLVPGSVGREDGDDLSAIFTNDLIGVIRIAPWDMGAYENIIHHYILSSALAGSNTGASWANAWTNFSSVTWTRGDNYYIGGGSYHDDISVSVNAVGTNWITLKKANVSDNSSDAGWDASYTNVASVVGSLYFDKGNVSIDGVTGSSTNNHGIKIWNTNSAPFVGTVVTLEGDTGPYTLLRCEFKGAGFNVSSNAADGIIWNNGADQGPLTVASNWIHEVTRNGITLGNAVGTSWDDYGLLWEGNVLSETGGCLDLNIHGQGMQICYAMESRYLIIRNSEFKNIVGSAMIGYLGGPSKHSYSRIYNNVFRMTDLDTYNGISPGVIWGHDGSTSISNIVIANNTFYGIGNLSHTESVANIAFDINTTNNILVNNIFELCHFPGAHGGLSTNSNNGYYNNTGSTSITNSQIVGTSSSLISPTTRNFNLIINSYAVNSGFTLSDVFTTDFNGSSRTVPWDLGAYEYQSTNYTRYFRANIIRVGTVRFP